MEVTKDNFDELLPEILQGIQDCTFIAVDTELTGLRPTDEKENYFDTVEERYRILRQSASKFLLVQFGMVLFFYEEDKDAFTQRAYNFYIFPNQFSSSAPNVRFLCEAPSLEFLASWGFDFNKLIYKGIPYLSLSVEQRMRDSYDKKQLFLAEENALPVSVPEHLKKFMEETQKQVKSLASGDVKELMLDDLNPFQRKLIFNNIKPKFPTLYFETVEKEKDQSDTELMDASSVSEASDTDSTSSPVPANNGGAGGEGKKAGSGGTAASAVASGRPQTPNAAKSSRTRSTYLRALRVAKMTEKEIKEREDEKKALAMETINKGAGFSKVIRKISSAGKIVVGHNMILDVAHSVHQFVGDLPEDLQGFKSLVQATFPNLVDTKLMCCTHPFREHFTSTVLADVLKRVQEEPFGLPTISKSGADNVLSYSLSDEKCHEAGYDAFITGVCFIGLCQRLGKLQTPKKDRVLPSSPLVMPFLNKLYLMRMLDISYMNISGTDLTPSRDHVFHVRCPKEATTKTIVKMFQPFGQVQIWWQDDNNLFVSLNDKDQASLVIRNIEYDKKSYRVMAFVQFQQQALAKLRRPHQRHSVSRCSNSSNTGNGAGGCGNPAGPKGVRQHSSSSTSSSGSNSSDAGGVSPPTLQTQSVHPKKKRQKTDKSKGGAGGGGGAAAVSNVAGGGHPGKKDAKSKSKTTTATNKNPHFEEPSNWD